QMESWGRKKLTPSSRRLEDWPICTARTLILKIPCCSRWRLVSSLRLRQVKLRPKWQNAGKSPSKSNEVEVLGDEYQIARSGRSADTRSLCNSNSGEDARQGHRRFLFSQ